MQKDQSIVSWTALISAYAQHGDYEKEALELFGLMQRKGKVTHELIIVHILHLCARQGAEAAGKLVHFYIVAGTLENGNVQLALIELYAKLKSFCDTCYMFNRICVCTTTSWNAMISALIENGQEKQALQTFEQLLQECFLPNRATSIIILNAIPRPSRSLFGKQMHTRIVLLGFVPNEHLEFDNIAQYGSCGNLEMAQRVFDSLPDHNVDAWKAIINAAFNSGKFAKGIGLFFQMQSEGVLGDKAIFLSILDACACDSSLARGKQMHVICMGVNCDGDVSIGTALINMHGRCGSLTESSRIFYELFERNLLTWTCMIAVLAQHGQGSSAILLFRRMQQEGMMPDEVTFTSVLSACARSGLNYTGFYYLLHMSDVHAVLPVPEHFNCIIDLLGKSGQVAELKVFGENMPVQPTAITWTISLDACRALSDIVYAEGYAKELFELDSEDATLFVNRLFSSIQGC